VNTLRQGLSLFSAICVLIGTVVVIQLWLLAAGLDALLSGDRQVLLPSAAASFALFVVDAGLLRLVRNLDRQVRVGPNGPG
jgi:hypothetical protein